MNDRLRAEFEAWAITKGYSLERVPHMPDAYNWPATTSAFDGYKAGAEAMYATAREVCAMVQPRQRPDGCTSRATCIDATGARALERTEE